VRRRHKNMTPTQARSGPVHALSCVVLTYLALLAFLALFFGHGAVLLARQPVRLGRAGARRLSQGAPRRSIRHPRFVG
jgi:hypothetical protein